MDLLVIAPTIIEIAVVLLAFIILYIASHFIQRRKIDNGHKQRTAKGIEAKAIILTMEETGLYMNKQPQVKLQVQVLPDRGRNFVTEIKPVLSPMELEEIRTGSTVTVFYNPANIKEVSFVKISSR